MRNIDRIVEQILTQLKKRHSDEWITKEMAEA